MCNRSCLRLHRPRYRQYRTVAYSRDSGQPGSHNSNALYAPDDRDGTERDACCGVKVADAEVRIVRASNYVRVVEEALRKTAGGNAELEEELGRARDELASATRQREEGEAEQRLADALLQRSFGVQACMLHSHTHPFDGPFSRTTRVGRYQKDKTNLSGFY